MSDAPQSNNLTHPFVEVEGLSGLDHESPVAKIFLDASKIVSVQLIDNLKSEEYEAWNGATGGKVKRTSARYRLELITTARTEHDFADVIYFEHEHEAKDTYERIKAAMRYSRL